MPRLCQHLASRLLTIKNLTVCDILTTPSRTIRLRPLFATQEPPSVLNQIPSDPVRDKDLPEIPDDTIVPEVVPESKPDWKSTAYATTKLAIDLVKESSDVFPPLKSVAGGLSAILNHCDVRFVSPKPDGSRRLRHF